MTDTLKDEIIALTMEAVEKAYQMGLTAGAKAEREACAKVCDAKVDAEYATGKVDHNERGWTQACAAAIRARTKGETNT